MKHCPFATLAAGLAVLAAALPAASIEPEATGHVATLPPVGEHWVLVPDRLFEHTLLFDGDRGEMLGSIPSPSMLTPKLPLLSRSRGEIYSVDLDYARGTRGARTDYVTVYDARTLEVSGEVVLPHPTSESNTSLHHADLLDGGRLLVVFSQFPSTVATVVDMADRSVVSEVPIAGCAGVYAAGPLRFATLCGDGSAWLALLDADGALRGTARSDSFFDVVKDPVGMAGVRIGASWIFVSFAGMVHELDLSSEKPVAKPAWPLLDEADRQARWRPGGLQPVALHREAKRLYVLMHQGGPGTHKDAGPEVWVYDLPRRTRVARMQVPNLVADFLGPLMGLEPGGMLHDLLRWLVPSEGAHSIAVTQDASPLLFTRNGELGVVAILDAESGEHLRNLTEVGLAGPSLGVP